MEIQMEDIVSKNYSDCMNVMATLRNIARRNNEQLIMHCQSPRVGWTPSHSIMAMSDKVILDDEIIKDRFNYLDKPIKPIFEDILKIS